jgi:hypothetical protein
MHLDDKNAYLCRLPFAGALMNFHKYKRTKTGTFSGAPVMKFLSQGSLISRKANSI